MQSTHRPALFGAAFLCVPMFASCIFAVDTTRRPPSHSSTLTASSEAEPLTDSTSGLQDEGKDKDKDKEKDPAKKAMERERNLAYAGFELKIAELSSTNDLREAETGLARARRGLDEARRDLEHFKAFDMPLSLEDKKIDLDRVTYRADESKEELAELENMYKKEEYASLTKELVVKRGRRQLELAQRDLSVEQRRYADLEQQEMAKKLRGLEDGVRKAEEEVASAESKLEKQKLENEVSLLKARHKLEDLEKEKAEAAEKAQKAEEAAKAGASS